MKVNDIVYPNQDNSPDPEWDYINYLDTSGIINNIISNIQRIEKGHYPSRAKRVVKKDNIIISTVRPNQCHYGIIKELLENMVVSTGFTVLEVKDGVFPEYLYYYLTQQNITKRLNVIADGATTSYPSINPQDILDIEINLPEANIQKKIAYILSTIDSKIYLNNKITKELDNMAKTLYNYWFVQFDFPDANNNPYRTSGGEMVYNGILKREIPKNWGCLELSKIVSRIATGLNPRQNFVLGKGSNYYVTIKNIDYGKLYLDEKCDKIDDEALRIINKRSDLNMGDILFTSIEPVGTTYFIQETPKNWNINESVFTIRPNYDLVTSEYLYMLLSGEEIKSFTKNVSTGSIHKGVRIEELNTHKSAYSNKNVITKYSNIIRPILKKIHILEKENNDLIHLKNFLLPSLMNGQVKVN